VKNRNFGLQMSFVFFLIIYLIPENYRNYLPEFCAVIASLFLVLAIFSPQRLNKIQILFFSGVHILRKLSDPLVILPLYYLIFTPYALYSRMIRKNLRIDTQFDSTKLSKSAWSRKLDLPKNQDIEWYRSTS
jgi:predicted membrane protein